MSQSFASKTMWADDNAFTTNALQPSLRSNSVGGARIFGREDGHRGSRQRRSCRARVLSDKSGGAMSGYFSVNEIDWIIQRALGTTGATPWIPGEAIASFFVLVDKVAAIYLSEQRVTSWEISGQEASYLNHTVTTVGGVETVWGSAFPSTPVPECGTSFELADVIFTYSGTAYKFKTFRLMIDNMIDDQQYENALTPTRFEAQDLAITLEMECALRSDTLALYRAALAGAAASLAISDGTTTYTFNFANLKIPDGAPSVPETGRIMMPLRMESFRSNSTGTAATDNCLRIVKS